MMYKAPRSRLIPLASGPCLLDQCTVPHRAGAVEAQHVRWFTFGTYLRRAPLRINQQLASGSRRDSITRKIIIPTRSRIVSIPQQHRRRDSGNKATRLLARSQSVSLTLALEICSGPSLLESSVSLSGVGRTSSDGPSYSCLAI